MNISIFRIIKVVLITIAVLITIMISLLILIQPNLRIYPPIYTYRESEKSELHGVITNQEYVDRGDLVITQSNPEYENITKWLRSRRVWLPYLTRFGTRQAIYSDQCMISKNESYILIITGKATAVHPQYQCWADGEINQIFDRLKKENEKRSQNQAAKTPTDHKNLDE